MKSLPYPYSVRPLEYSDLKMVLDWRNSERIHSVMLTDHQITWEEHIKWFKNTSIIFPRRQLVFLYNNEPIGYIGYNAFNDTENSCSPGAYIGNSNAEVPIDAAFYLFYCAIEYAFCNLGVKSLKTEVLKNNKKAYKIDKILGYEVIGDDKIIKNNRVEDIYIMRLSLEKWKKIKNNFV